MSDGIHIRQLAACFGLNPKTILYYEAIGLLPRADRSPSSYRHYTHQDVERLSFIRHAKTRGVPPCRQVLDLIDRKIRTIDQRICELTAFHAELATLQTTSRPRAYESEQQMQRRS